jgi:hypothetical protein
MKILSYVLLSAFLYLNILPGVLIDSSDKLIIDNTLNNNFEKADSLLKIKLASNPDDIKYHFFQLNNNSFKSISKVSQAKKSERGEIREELNEKIIEYGEMIIEQFEDRELSIHEKFYLGCIHGYLGRLYGLDGSWMSAFSSGKAGKSLLEEVVEADSTYYDAYLLLGMFHYYGDRMGGFIEFIASILGFSGDRELGLEYLHLAEKKGNFTRPQAQLILAELYSRLESNKFKGLQYFEAFLEKYPNNPVFLNWYCRDLISLDMIDKLGEVIENDDLGLIDSYIKGNYKSRIGEYENSNIEFENLLDNSEYYWSRMKGEAELQLTVNSWILQDSTTFNRYYPELSEKGRKTADYLTDDRELTMKFLDFRKNITFANDAESSEAMIENPPVFGNNKLLEGLFEFYKGIFYFRANKYALAETAFEAAAGIYEDELKYPSISYLIEIYHNVETEREKVELLIEEAEELDYESLNYRLKDLEERYNL